MVSNSTVIHLSISSRTCLPLHGRNLWGGGSLKFLILFAIDFSYMTDFISQRQFGIGLSEINSTWFVMNSISVSRAFKKPTFSLWSSLRIRTRSKCRIRFRFNVSPREHYCKSSRRIGPAKWWWFRDVYWSSSSLHRSSRRRYESVAWRWISAYSCYITEAGLSIEKNHESRNAVRNHPRAERRSSIGGCSFAMWWIILWVWSGCYPTWETNCASIGSEATHWNTLWDGLGSDIATWIQWKPWSTHTSTISLSFHNSSQMLRLLL
jgi:hypothetical protein